jgi:hypothetical protein
MQRMHSLLLNVLVLATHRSHIPDCCVASVAAKWDGLHDEHTHNINNNTKFFAAPHHGLCGPVLLNDAHAILSRSLCVAVQPAARNELLHLRCARIPTIQHVRISKALLYIHCHKSLICVPALDASSSDMMRVILLLHADALRSPQHSRLTHTAQ